ncbi:hypothetical protein B0H14DRAFT_2590374 [Mycena olivaceomarginata]|nr:hypothetical protein B0H14DRAFT_2590374 [Mycena olivaceomarginata]
MFSARALLTAIILAPLALAAPALGPKGVVACGRNIYDPSQVNSAVSSGFAQLRKGSSIGGYPHALEMLRQKYPLSSQCYGLPVFEYPLIPGRIYDGRTDPGPDRAVFSNTDCNSLLKSTASVLTHTGAGKDLVGCSVSELRALPPTFAVLIILLLLARAPPKAAEELVGAPVAVVRLGVRSTASK